MIWFWAALTLVSLAAFAAPFVVYPLWTRLRVRRYAVGLAPMPTAWPRLSMVLAVFNGAARIGSKIRELRALEYPGEREIVVADDGSNDATADLAQAAGADRVIRMPKRLGKSEAQNAAVQAATGDVLLFTDLGVTVQPAAAARLVAELLENGVGCVTGVDRSVAGSTADVTAAAGRYTRFEAALRQREAETGTLLGVNGCLFAVRKAHRPPVPRECVDDLYVPLAVIDRGLRVTVRPDAVAEVPRAKNLAEEYRRKVRTFTGGLFTLHEARYALPRAARRLRWQLIGHKWLRWVGPFLLLTVAFGSLGWAWRWPWAWALVVAEAAGLALGLAGLLLAVNPERQPSPLLRWPAMLVLAQTALVHAWIRYATGRPYVTWQPTRRGTDGR
jgi:glycosyltransferase involved in cell wall biosynthesis